MISGESCFFVFLESDIGPSKEPTCSYFCPKIGEHSTFLSLPRTSSTKCYFRFPISFKVYLLYPPNSTPRSNHSKALAIFSRYHTYHFVSLCLCTCPFAWNTSPLPIGWVPSHPSRPPSLGSAHSVLPVSHQVTFQCPSTFQQVLT